MPQPEPTHPARTLSAESVPAGTYAVDPRRSVVRFRAKAFGLVWVRGSMPVAEGTVRVADGRLQGLGEIAADAVNTGLAPRDRHLRTSHYLHTAKHPRIRVSADDIDAGRVVACTVTVRDIASTVSVDVHDISATDDTLRIDAGVTLDRSPFPMFPPLAGVSRMVHIEITVFASSADRCDVQGAA